LKVSGLRDKLPRSRIAPRPGGLRLVSGGNSGYTWAVMPPLARGETRILVWMCVLIGVNQLGFGSVVPVLPLYARSFGASQTAIGLAIAVYGLARFLVAVPVGQLADRVGRRAATALGGLVTAARHLLCPYA